MFYDGWYEANIYEIALFNLKIVNNISITTGAIKLILHNIYKK